MRISICLLLLHFGLCSCKYQVVINPPWKKPISTQGVNFYTSNFKSRLDSATKQGTPVFIDFYTTWCGPCKKMDRETFKDEGLADFLNRKFVCLKIDAEKGEGRALAQHFQVHAYPTLMFVNKAGVTKYEGVMQPGGLLRRAKKAL